MAVKETVDLDRRDLGKGRRVSPALGWTVQGTASLLLVPLMVGTARCAVGAPASIPPPVAVGALTITPPNITGSASAAAMAAAGDAAR